MKTIIFLFIILTMIFIVSCTNNSDSPSFDVDSYEKDLGEINPKKGFANTSFTIKNKGSEELIITNLATSCGCTTANIDKINILPDEIAIVDVSYDPNAHPEIIGDLKRYIFFETNDPKNNEVELIIKGNQLENDREIEVKEHIDEVNDFEISPRDAYEKLKENNNIKLLDVRELNEYEENHLIDSSLLSVNEITEEKLLELGFNKDDEIILYCRSGKRSALAYEIMSDLGYMNMKSLNGGIIHWQGESFPVVGGHEDHDDEH